MLNFIQSDNFKRLNFKVRPIISARKKQVNDIFSTFEKLGMSGYF